MVQATLLTTPPAKTASASQDSAKVQQARSAKTDGAEKSQDDDQKFTLASKDATHAKHSDPAQSADAVTAQADSQDAKQDDESTLDEVMALIASLTANHEAAQQPLKTSAVSGEAAALNGLGASGKFDALAKLQAGAQDNPFASQGSASSSLTDSKINSQNLLAQLQASAKLDGAPLDKNLVKLASAQVEGSPLSSASLSALMASSPNSNTTAQPGLHTNPAAMTTGSEWASMRIDTSAGKWGEQMLQVLQDRVTLQAQQNLQEAKIRLDPPELGKLDLMVRVEGDRLSVQIHSNTAVTREALMQISDRLRSELQNQNFMHVDVNVSSGDGGRGNQPSSQDEEPTTIFASRGNDNGIDALSSSQSEHWLNTQA